MGIVCGSVAAGLLRQAAPACECASGGWAWLLLRQHQHVAYWSVLQPKFAAVADVDSCTAAFGRTHQADQRLVKPSARAEGLVADSFAVPLWLCCTLRRVGCPPVFKAFRAFL